MYHLKAKIIFNSINIFSKIKQERKRKRNEVEIIWLKKGSSKYHFTKINCLLHDSSIQYCLAFVMISCRVIYKRTEILKYTKIMLICSLLA